MARRNQYQGKQSGAECPECGSILTMVTQVDFTEAPENYRAREHRCSECDHTFCSVQVVIPDIKFSRIAANFRLRRKEWAHKRYGFHNTRTYRPEMITADRVKVRYEILPGVRSTYDAEFCGGGHPRNEENTYWRKDGKRECRQCKADRSRAYREENRELIAAQSRARYQRRKAQRQSQREEAA